MIPCASADNPAGNCRPDRGTPKKSGPWRSLSGEVTILMALVTIMIFSLILVSLESARQQGAVSMLRMNVQTAAESVLGEYYAPLFDDYGLYGLYDVDIAGELQSCLETSGSPQSPVDGSSPGESRSYYSYAYEISDVALTKTVSLLHGGGALCKNQMIEEGAISGIQELVELLLRAVNLLKESEQSIAVIEEQQKIERELAVFDGKLLQLMQLLDGIQTNSGGVVFQDNGKPVPVSRFVKRASVEPVSPETLHINNSMFYETVSPICFDVKALSREIVQRFSGIEDKPDEESVRVYLVYVLAVRESLFAARDALPILDELIELQDRFRPMVTKFESFMQSCRALIDDDMYKSMEETLRILKGYVGAGNGRKTYDFAKMKETLSTNIEVLTPIVERTYVMPAKLYDWQLAVGICTRLTGFSLDGLELDYSTVKKSTAENSSFWKTVKNILENGIVGGVYPSDETLSTTTLRWESDRPSNTMTGDISSLYVFPGLKEDGTLGIDFLKKLLDGNLLRNMLDRLAKGIVNISEKLLLITYFHTHMSNYTDTSHSGVMHYEEEYLLFGKDRDDQNQRSATLAILGIRVLMNVVHVFSDSLKSAEALAIATELLSAVPFPVVIKVAQYLIQIVWAIQNAYLETAEILRGKPVPLVVTTGSFQLSLAGAFTMTRSRRVQTAKEYKPVEGFKLGYEHYLLLFMLVRNSDTMTGRALDLIQMNIRAKYDPQFTLQKCTYGFEASVSAELPMLYTTALSGEDDGSAYTIHEDCAISY